MKKFKIITEEREFCIYSVEYEIEAETKEEAIKRFEEGHESLKHIDSETLDYETVNIESLKEYVEGKKQLEVIEEVQEIDTKRDEKIKQLQERKIELQNEINNIDRQIVFS